MMSFLKNVCFFLALACLTCGCLELKEDFRLNQDGSAKVVIAYSIAETYKILLDDTEAVVNKSSDKSKRLSTLSRFFNKTKAQAYFSTFRGVELDTYMAYRQNGRLHTYMVLKVKNLKQSLDNGFLPGHRLNINDKTIEFSWENPIPSRRLFENEELKKSLSGLKVELNLTLPWAVTHTNGQKSEKKNMTASWNFKELDLFEFNERRFFAACTVIKKHGTNDKSDKPSGRMQFTLPKVTPKPVVPKNTSQTDAKKTTSDDEYDPFDD